MTASRRRGRVSPARRRPRPQSAAGASRGAAEPEFRIPTMRATVIPTETRVASVPLRSRNEVIAGPSVAADQPTLRDPEIGG